MQKRAWVARNHVGDAASNQQLSEARVRSVIAAIVYAGIDDERLSAAGYDSERPMADNLRDEERARKRRLKLVKQP